MWWMLLSALVPAAHSQPGLTVTGTCPGPIQVDVVGVTPGARLAVISGDAPGADTIPGGACGGSPSGLSGLKLAALRDDTDGDGEFHEGPAVSDALCGRFVQAVDLTACSASDVVQLLTGTCEVSGRMALVPGGRFVMGSPPGEVGQDLDEHLHDVRLTHSYCIDRTEVTQAEFEAVAGTNPSANAGCPTCPVERVTWHEAAWYANILSGLEGLAPCYSCAWQYVVGRNQGFYGWVCDPVGSPYACEGYRLPTEAEWERAARGGLAGAAFPNGGSLFPGDAGDCGGNLMLTDGSLLDDVAWTCGNTPGFVPRQVGLLLPNAYGLYDMSGNVYELCFDRDGPLGPCGGDCVDPFGPAGLSPWFPGPVSRGGAAGVTPRYARVAERGGAAGAFTRGPILGLRLARSNP